MPYCDLRVEIKDKEKAVRFAKLLGINYIGLETAEIGERVDEVELVKILVLRPRSDEELRSMIRKVRNKVEVVIVESDEYDLIRLACSDTRVDLLSLVYPRGAESFDHICARLASENNVALEINFSFMLNSKNRVRTFRALRKVIMLCEKYKTPMIIVSGARDEWELRAPRDLASIASVLGMDVARAIEGVSDIPFNLIKRNREKLSGKRIGDALKVVEGGDLNEA